MTAPTSEQPAEKLMTWPDLLERPRPEPTETIHYGSDSLQVADLWLPAGRGPHPAVLMVHGGCWQTGIADRRIMDWIADDLRKRGIAVWNIDYRGVDRAGGGYPGTFLDAAAAADALRDAAPKYGLNIDRLVAVGHSAGGHLALWLAGRRPDDTAPFEISLLVEQEGVESSVLEHTTTGPVEAAVRDVAGVREIGSQIQRGRSLTTILFDKGTDSGAALATVNGLLPSIRRALPTGSRVSDIGLIEKSAIPSDSPLFAVDPLPITAVISAGGLPDLKLTETPPGTGCGLDVVRRLVGSPSPERPDVFADTSVMELPFIRARQFLVNGPEDRIIPLFFASDYAEKRRGRGEQVEVHVVPHTGHVELVAPETAAWKQQVALIEKILHEKPQAVRVRIQ
jgi:acetyl esterase/lipase